jgi:hypothetical protein
MRALYEGRPLKQWAAPSRESAAKTAAQVAAMRRASTP